MKTIFDKYDKEAINGLERALFQGRIEVVQSLYEAERAVKYLLSQPILGFDTETKPQFQRGHTSLVALLQVSSKDVCFLFRLNVLGLPDCIKRLLSDEGETLKIGLSWHDDLCGLRRRGEFHPGTFIEIQQIAKDMGLHDLSLQKLYANLMGKRISKTQRLSNWEADRLTDAQKQYAATDAWACIQLYEEMVRMRQEGYLIQVTPVAEAPKPMVISLPEDHTAPDAVQPAKPKRTRKAASKESPARTRKAKDTAQEATVAEPKPRKTTRKRKTEKTDE